jgi:NAD+ kinase
MTMPLDLVLVRHGESEGNVARKFSDGGDDSIFTEEFCNRHNSRLRLTDRGRDQARAASVWLRENVGERFDRYLVSGFLRAMETAALLNLPDAQWYQDFYLRERDLGMFDIMPEGEKRTKYPEVFHRYRLDPFYWTPPNGESMAQLCLRIDRVLQTLHRECSEKRVIIVCHGLVMWAFMIRIERLTPPQFLERAQSKAIADKIRNGQIIHYTRHNPDDQTLSPRADWVRSVCPWDVGRSSLEWRRIQRPRWTNSDLLELVEASPRIVA